MGLLFIKSTPWTVFGFYLIYFQLEIWAGNVMGLIQLLVRTIWTAATPAYRQLVGIYLIHVPFRSAVVRACQYTRLDGDYTADPFQIHFRVPQYPKYINNQNNH